MAGKRILGVDPGSLITGWGIIEFENNRLVHVDNGGIFTRNKEFHARLEEIHDGLIEVIKTYKPELASLEQVFVSKNAQSALKLGQARGVALIVMLKAGLKVHEYTPSAIKQAVTGNGRADKQQVARMVQAMLGLPEPAQTDASDALGAAICHALCPKIPTALEDVVATLPNRTRKRRKRQLP